MFLFTGLTPVLFTVFFLIKQQNIRHEMKQKLENEMLHTIVVPKKDVAWVKHNKEISIGNKLFDVKSYTDKNGQIFFVGLFDEEETSLNKLMEKDTHKKNKNELAQLFQLLQSPCINLTFDTGLIITNEKSFSFPILLNISSPFNKIPTPPPQGMII